MAFTLRPDETQQAALDELAEFLGERTQTKALWRAVTAFVRLRQNNDAQAARIRALTEAVAAWDKATDRVSLAEQQLDAARAAQGEAGRTLAGLLTADERGRTMPAWIGEPVEGIDFERMPDGSQND